MKTITFQIDDTGKVQVFPKDDTGNMLDNRLKFNNADLDAVQQCLSNIKIYPQLYGITSVPFESSGVEVQLTDTEKEKLVSVFSEKKTPLIKDETIIIDEKHD